MVRAAGGGGVAAFGENGGDGEADYTVSGGGGKLLVAGLAGKRGERGGYPAPKMVTLVIVGVREEKVCVLYV